VKAKMRTNPLVVVAAVVAGCSVQDVTFSVIDGGSGVGLGGSTSAGAGTGGGSLGGGAATGGAPGAGGAVGLGGVGNTGGGGVGGAAGSGGTGNAGGAGVGGATGSGGSSNTGGTTCATPPCCTSGLSACGAACADVQSDGANCGDCGISCGGGDCTAAVCQPKLLATGLYYPSLIAVGDTYLFFTDGTLGEIQTMPKDGSAAPTVFLSGQGSITKLQASGNRILWNSDSGDISSALDDGTGQVTAITPAPSNWMVYKAKLYWFTWDTYGCTCHDQMGYNMVCSGSGPTTGCSDMCTCTAHTGQLYKANLDGSGATAIGAGGLSNMSKGMGINDTAAFGAYVYLEPYSNCFGTTGVTRFPLTGATAQPFAQQLVGGALVGVDNLNVYANDINKSCGTGTSRFLKATATGGTFQSITDLGYPDSLIAGATRDFGIVGYSLLTSFDQAGVVGGYTTLYPTVRAIALDAQFVYFADYQNGTVGLVRQH
jgi:hypothetical protein